MIPVMLVSIWLHFQVLDDQRYTESIRALGSDAGFQEAFGDQVSRLLNAEITKLSETSYAALAASYVEVAGGIDAVKALVEVGVASLIQSPIFEQYWVQINQTTHRQLVDFIRGESSVLVSDDRYGVSLDLGVVAGWVDPFIDGAASDALVLGTSDGTAQIQIAESSRIPTAEWVSRNSVAVAIGSTLIFVVLQTLAIVFASNRKQAVMFAAIGIAIVAGATLLASRTVAADHLSRIRDEGGRSLAQEYVNALMSDLVLMTGIVALGALLTGVALAALPYIRRDSRTGAAISPSMPSA
jgi:hypothetical protein